MVPERSLRLTGACGGARVVLWQPGGAVFSCLLAGTLLVSVAQIIVVAGRERRC